MGDESDLPLAIGKAKRLIVYSMNLLKLRGTIRTEAKQVHDGRVFTFTVVIPIVEASTSFRELKRQGLRQRG